MEYINKRIEKEICYETINKLSDENLLNEYMKCSSSKKQVVNLENILIKYVNNKTKEKIINEYILELIPPGTKGVIRGNKFNNIVKNKILELKLDETLYEIGFEAQPDGYNIEEKPDWYIRELKTNKILIGMNQLDLWGGGAQCNRGSKYIFNSKYNNDNSKLLCVVCNHVQFKRSNNKTYRLFVEGYNNNTLCYLNNLKNLIFDFFEIKN